MKVGLKFMLKGGHFLAVVVDKAHSIDILRCFRDGPRPPEDTFSCIDTGVSWVVDTNSIVAIHTFEPEQAIQQSHPAPMGPVWTPTQGQFRSN